MVREDACSELRVVRRADDVRRRAANDHHFPVVFLITSLSLPSHGSPSGASPGSGWRASVAGRCGGPPGAGAVLSGADPRSRRVLGRA
jgi:hypothetical protein